MVRLLRLQSRRDHRQLLIWLVAIGVLVVATASSVKTEFPTEAERVKLLSLALVTPALVALRGVPQGPSVGSAVFFQVYSWLAVVVGLLNTFLATRHGRGDEEHGRRELVVAAAVRRTSPVLATLALGLLVNLAVAVLGALGFVASGLDRVGAAVAGLAFAATGIAFLGIGLLANQVMATSRAANGLAGGLVGLAYLLRAAGDALGTVDLPRLTIRVAWPSWLSPIGWGEQTFAFTSNRWWPLLPGLALGAVTAGAALVVQAQRDLGGSAVPQRRGRADAPRTLRSNLALNWRLQWPSVLGWTLGGALLGLFTGSLAAAVVNGDLLNDEVRRVLASIALGGGGDLVSLLISAIVGLVCILAAAAGVQSVLRLRSDETDGGAELVLAGPVSRRAWLLDAVLVATVAVSAVVLGAGVAAAVSFLAVDDQRHARIAFLQALVGGPAALVFVGLTAVLVVVLPRWVVGLAWGLLAVGAVLGLLGGLLRLPYWVGQLSPFSHVPGVPVEHWGPQVLMLLIAVGLTGAAAGALRRRDLTP